MASADVNTPGEAYLDAEKAYRWNLLAALEGGTVAMREAGTKFLPQFPRESNPEYATRRDSTFLYGMFSKAVGSLESKPFSRSVTVQGTLPELLEAMTLDMDGMGSGLAEFERQGFRNGLIYGLDHVLVDMAKVPGNAELLEKGLDPTQDPGKANRGEEQDAGGVTAIRIVPPNLIDWHFVDTPEGRVLSEIRFRSSRTNRDGFEQKIVRQVVHYRSDSIDLWEDVDGDDTWAVVGSSVHNFGRVPLDTTYFDKVTELTARPPLLELAEINLDHWQLASDHKALEHVVSIAILMTKGFSADEQKRSAVIGPRRMLHAKASDASAGWVEHSGAGIGTLRDGLQKREDRGAEVGFQPTSQSKSPITATGEIKDSEDTDCNLKSWVRAKATGSKRVLELAGEWLGLMVPEDTVVDIYTGFTVGPEREKEIDQLQKDADAGRISPETYLREAQKRRLYSEDLEVEEEVEAAREEADRRLDAFSKGLEAPNEDDDDDGDEAA